MYRSRAACIPDFYIDVMMDDFLRVSGFRGKIAKIGLWGGGGGVVHISSRSPCR